MILGETSSTAYRGDRGKIAYDDSQANKTAIGTLANLLTTAKTNLVAAINELFNGKQKNITAGNGISKTTGTTTDTIAVDAMPSTDMSEIVTPLPGCTPKWHTYSTNEQAIGTWIDGKTIYEKTVKFTTTSIGTSWTSVCNLGITNVNCVKIDYILKQNNGAAYYSSIAQIAHTVATGLIQAKSLSGAALPISTDSTVTIQYTKS